MSVLVIDSSIRGDYSVSRGLAKKFLEAYKEKHADDTIELLDIAANPPPHLDFEGLSAGFTPEDKRSPEAAAKHNYRLELISKFTAAKTIVISAPFFNWGVPSNLKALIDQIIMPGKFDAHSKSLAGKSVTVLISSGGGYTEGSGKEHLDFESKYLESLFGLLGSTDVKVIRSEFGYAKFGVADLNEAHEKSHTAAVEAAIARAQSL